MKQKSKTHYSLHAGTEDEALTVDSTKLYNALNGEILRCDIESSIRARNDREVRKVASSSIQEMKERLSKKIDSAVLTAMGDTEREISSIVRSAMLDSLGVEKNFDNGYRFSSRSSKSPAQTYTEEKMRSGMKEQIDSFVCDFISNNSDTIKKAARDFVKKEIGVILKKVLVNELESFAKQEITQVVGEIKEIARDEVRKVSDNLLNFIPTSTIDGYTQYDVSDPNIFATACSQKALAAIAENLTSGKTTVTKAVDVFAVKIAQSI